MSITFQPPTAALSDARPGPSRNLLRSLLIAVIAVALMATALITAPASHAAPGNYKPLTWNMQGGNGEKWTFVGTLSVGGPNRDAHNVIALQEAGPESSLPGTSTGQGFTIRTQTTGVTYRVTERTWQIGSTTRGGRKVWLYHVQTDTGGNRNNLAFVTHEEINHADMHAVLQNNAVTTGSNPRPATYAPRPILGIRMADGSYFHNIHASSNGPTDTNEVNNALTYLRNYHAPNGGTINYWAVLGDFNRDPSARDSQGRLRSPVNLPTGTAMYRANQPTQTGDGRGELDYMVSNDTQNMAGWTGRRLDTTGGSDHFPVEFSFRASAERETISPADAPETCLEVGAPGDDYVYVSDTARCDGVGNEDMTWQGSAIMIARPQGLACLGLENGATGAGTYVTAQTCNNANTQQWKRHPEGIITSVAATGKCLDLSRGQTPNARWLEIQACDYNTYPLEQQWIAATYAPYMWAFLAVVGGWNGLDHQTP